MTREDEVFEKLKTGDKSGAGELVELYYAEIFRYCLLHAPDRQAAEDAVQETFLKVFRYLDDYRHQGKFRTYLYRVAANVCIDLCRKKRWGPLSESVPYEEQGIEEGEEKEDFKRLVGILSEALREIVILRFSQELKLKEIARVTGTPVCTVQSRLRKALKILEKELGRRGES